MKTLLLIPIFMLFYSSVFAKPNVVNSVAPVTPFSECRGRWFFYNKYCLEPKQKTTSLVSGELLKYANCSVKNAVENAVKEESVPGLALNMASLTKPANAMPIPEASKASVFYHNAPGQGKAKPHDVCIATEDLGSEKEEIGYRQFNKNTPNSSLVWWATYDLKNVKEQVVGTMDGEPVRCIDQKVSRVGRKCAIYSGPKIMFVLPTLTDTQLGQLRQGTPLSELVDLDQIKGKKKTNGASGPAAGTVDE